MRAVFLVLFLSAFVSLFGQTPIYHFVFFNKTLAIPANLNSGRSIVIFSIPEKEDDFIEVGKYQRVLSQVHKALVIMGVDVVFYLNELNFTANYRSRVSYTELLNTRKIKNIIFFTQTKLGFELLISPFDGTEQLIKEGEPAFYIKDHQLSSLLLNVGREVRRAGQELNNFLILEKPTYLDGLSVIEKKLLKNYPGILRRSKLLVERFALLDTTNTSNESIETYNLVVIEKNKELKQIMTSYPYEYELIDAMSDEKMKKNRYQFLLRSISSSAGVVKQMLGYKLVSSDTAFISMIPIMPDRIRKKIIPKDALVHKFYIRQNISKNIHVGKWDADVTWQQALQNMIGNLTQKLRVKN